MRPKQRPCNSVASSPQPSASTRSRLFLKTLRRVVLVNPESTSDKAKVKVYDISPLGIMQISRQRLRKAGTNFSHQGCEACQGRGWHPGDRAPIRRMG
mgnify:CR=1 FL=1